MVNRIAGRAFPKPVGRFSSNKGRVMHQTIGSWVREGARARFGSLETRYCCVWPSVAARPSALGKADRPWIRGLPGGLRCRPRTPVFGNDHHLGHLRKGGYEEDPGAESEGAAEGGDLRFSRSSRSDLPPAHHRKRRRQWERHRALRWRRSTRHDGQPDRSRLMAEEGHIRRALVRLFPRAVRPTGRRSRCQGGGAVMGRLARRARRFRHDPAFAFHHQALPRCFGRLRPAARRDALHRPAARHALTNPRTLRATP